MKANWIRVCNLLLIIFLLLGYNQVLTVRAAEEEAAKLTAELASAELEAEQLKLALNQTEEAEQHEAVGSEVTQDEAHNNGAYKDGTYEGTAEGFGGPITVTVTVSDGKLADITVTEASGEDGTFLDMGKEVISRILDAQSTDVDSVSGATFSSGGIRQAAEEALKDAV